MAVTLTTVKKPVVVAPKMKVAIYQVLFDDAYAAGGEPIDLTADFDHVFAIIPGGNDTLADNGHKFDAILPAPTVAVAADNVKLSVFWSADGVNGEPFAEFAGNLASVGQLSIVVYGD